MDTILELFGFKPKEKISKKKGVCKHVATRKDEQGNIICIDCGKRLKR